MVLSGSGRRHAVRRRRPPGGSSGQPAEDADARRPRLARARHAVREVAFIVVGVLIALGANSWWEGQRDEVRTTEYLMRLAEDLGTMRGAVEEAQRSHGQILAQTRSVLRQLRAGPSPESIDSLRTALGWIAVINMIEVHNGTYEEMLATGSLGLLRSDSLRAALRAYQGALQYHREAERFALQQYHSRIEPFLARNLVYSDVAALGYRDAIGASPFTQDYGALFRSVELWNTASLKLEVETFMGFSTRRLLAAVEEADRAVLAELRRIDPRLAEAAARRAAEARGLGEDDLRRFLETESGGAGGSGDP